MNYCKCGGHHHDRETELNMALALEQEKTRRLETALEAAKVRYGEALDAADRLEERLRAAEAAIREICSNRRKQQ